MTVLFLWRTVWEPFLEDSTSHRFMHPVEWRGGFHDMELFGKSKRAWLQTFLALPNGGIRLRRDSLVSVRYAEELNSTTSSVTLQRTDRHGILGQKSSHLQVSL
jgi:hypothetical protein